MSTSHKTTQTSLNTQREKIKTYLSIAWHTLVIIGALACMGSGIWLTNLRNSAGQMTIGILIFLFGLFVSVVQTSRLTDKYSRLKAFIKILCSLIILSAGVACAVLLPLLIDTVSSAISYKIIAIGLGVTIAATGFVALLMSITPKKVQAQQSIWQSVCKPLLKMLLSATLICLGITLSAYYPLLGRTDNLVPVLTGIAMAVVGFIATTYYFGAFIKAAMSTAQDHTPQNNNENETQGNPLSSIASATDINTDINQEGNEHTQGNKSENPNDSSLEQEKTNDTTTGNMTAEGEFNTKNLPFTNQ